MDNLILVYSIFSLSTAPSTRMADTYLLEHVLERGVRALQHRGVRGIERVS